MQNKIIAADPIILKVFEIEAENGYTDEYLLDSYINERNDDIDRAIAKEVVDNEIRNLIDAEILERRIVTESKCSRLFKSEDFNNTHFDYSSADLDRMVISTYFNSFEVEYNAINAEINDLQELMDILPVAKPDLQQQHAKLLERCQVLAGKKSALRRAEKAFIGE
jgi:hypothetical protein